MTDTNQVRLAYVDEGTSWGVTPTTPQLRTIRYVNQNITFAQEKIASPEKVGDRMTTDLIAVGARVSNGYTFVLSYGEHDELVLANVLKNTWTNTPQKENVTADSSITDAGTVADTYAVDAGGAAFTVGSLVRASGFTTAANNKVFRVASSTATTVVGSSLSLVAEAAPPVGARLKVVGFEGASGDITATATGLGSTVLSFTALGFLRVGQWVKIGGALTGEQFGTAALNSWARITVIAANALTLDNLPTGWTTDSGTSKTIKVWCGDSISNGATARSATIEVGYLGQSTPNYLSYTGMSANEVTLTFTPGRPIDGTVNFLGKSANAATTTPLDATVTGSYTGDIMNAASNVARISEGGATVASPSYVRRMTISINNNMYDKTGVGFYGLVGTGLGPMAVTGQFLSYFEDATRYNKVINNTATSTSIACVSNNQYYVFQVPRCKLDGNPTDEDQEVILDTTYTAIKDSLTGKVLIIDRGEYVE